MMTISNVLLNLNEFLVLHSSNSLVNSAGFEISKIFKEVQGKSVTIISWRSLPDTSSLILSFTPLVVTEGNETDALRNT